MLPAADSTNSERTQPENAVKSRKPKTHEIKCWPQFFGPVADGTKPFEIRENDRDYRVGDTLHIREWCPTKRDLTGCECRAIISYLTPWEQIKGNVVLGIKLLSQDAECSQLGVKFSEFYQKPKP